MGSLGFVVVGAFLIAVIGLVSIIIFKNILFPSKLDGVPRLLKEGKFQAAQRCTKVIIFPLTFFYPPSFFKQTGAFPRDNR